jgi:hypothetical protein
MASLCLQPGAFRDGMVDGQDDCYPCVQPDRAKLVRYPFAFPHRSCVSPPSSPRRTTQVTMSFDFQARRADIALAGGVNHRMG